jgi:hypothetical protein
MISLQAPSQIINNDETFAVIREGCVQFVDGKPVKSKISRFQIRGTIQPLNGRELLLVPENDRFKEQYWVYSQNEILVNDRFIRCGVNFQVQDVEAWGSFFKARLMRIDVGPNATP